MSPSENQRGRTFINVTEDPRNGRHARRTNVRRAVMLDYHKRRKRGETRPSILANAPALAIRPVESDDQPLEPVSDTSIDGTATISSNADMSSLLTQLQPRATHLFQPKRWTAPHHIRTSSLIIRFLCGQSRKATHDMSYVAFVHRRFNDANRNLELDPNNPLKVCEQILRTNSESDIELWELIGQEQERVYTQSKKYGKWELLSGAQAMTLYILLWLRKRPESTTFPCGNLALLFTLGNVFNLLKDRHLHISPDKPILKPVTDWQGWIFRESSLRTATVYFILTIVISMDFGFKCNQPTSWCLGAMPLPATKASWEADSELSWGICVGNRLNPDNRPVFRDIKEGGEGEEVLNGDWGEELDELGLIVAMAATLPSNNDQTR